MANNEFPDLRTLQFLVDRVESFGDRPAAIQFRRKGKKVWTCSQVAREANRLASGLREDGVAVGETVAVIAEPSPEWFVAALAILRRGGILVPIDAQMSDEDLERVFDDSQVRRVFATARVARRIEEMKGHRDLEVFLLDETEETARERGGKHWRSLFQDPPPPKESVGERETAVLFYTSGTTGPPKGVPLSHRNIAYQLRVIQGTGLVREDDRMLLPLPLHHVYPLVIGMFTPLGLGVAILLPHALTGDAIVRALVEGKGSVILGVPRLYRALYEGIRAKVGPGLFSGAMSLARGAGRIGIPVGRLLFRPIRQKMGPRVRMLASGGSPLDPELAENLEALGWPVAVGYGLTETSPLLTLKRPREGDFATVGRAIEGVELKIDPSVLPEGEREAQEAGNAEQERGEVLARGPNVFSGYHNLPEKTAEALEDGWFRTGDIGRLDQDGFLYLGGRASSMIVLEGGENINPEDLESFYSEADEVAEVGILEDKGKLAALAVPDRAVLREYNQEDVSAMVRRALEAKASGLASYKRLSNIEVTRQSLPATRLGKIKRHLLIERYEAAKKGEEEGRREKGAVAVDRLSSDDRALLEDPRVRKMWDFLAKRYADRRLTPDASLELDLGIDSLEWVELSLSAQQRVGITITEDIIEGAETVRDLLEAAASAEEAETGEGKKRPIENPEEVLRETDRRWATPAGPVVAGVAGMAYWLLRVLLKVKGCRVESRGLENLPEKGPYIIVPNHVSFLDSPALCSVLGPGRLRNCFWAGRAEVMFRGYFRRAVSRLFQVVPIDPRRGPLSSLAVGALVVKRNYPLVWFPEGHISRDGTLQQFQPGIGLIVAHYRPPVVPVFIDGTHDLMPLGRKIPRAGRVTVYFGPAIEGTELIKEAEGISEGEVHKRIASVLRNHVQGLADSARAGGDGEGRGGGRKAA